MIKLKCATSSEGTILGIGDDAAILQTDPNLKLTVSTDTLVSGVHFNPEDPPRTIGHKALAVNLSDMAAMGSMPKWALLNLTLPNHDQTWLEEFISGFADLLATHQVQLVGGDTTQGPLNIAVTVMGETAKPIRRDGAQVDDLVVISGKLGSAAFALNNPQRCETCDHQLKTPTPRLDLAAQVKGFVTAMIDVSDGIIADLGHICRASGRNAVLELSQIPINRVITEDQNWQQHVLAGGDDYQLCFTIKPEHRERLPAGCHVIGHITDLKSNPDIDPAIEPVSVFNNNQPITIDFKGYQHFNHD